MLEEKDDGHLNLGRFLLLGEGVDIATGVSKDLIYVHKQYGHLLELSFLQDGDDADTVTCATKIITDVWCTPCVRLVFEKILIGYMPSLSNLISVIFPTLNYGL